MQLTIVGVTEGIAGTLRINADHIVSLDPVDKGEFERSLAGVYIVTAPGSGLQRSLFVPEPLAAEVIAWWDAEAAMFGGMITERTKPPIRLFPGEIARREIERISDLYALLADMTEDETGDLVWTLHQRDLNPSEMCSILWRNHMFTIHRPYISDVSVYKSIGYAGDFLLDRFSVPNLWRAIGTRPHTPQDHNWKVSNA